MQRILLLTGIFLSVFSASCSHTSSTQPVSHQMHKISPKLYVDKAMPAPRQLILQQIIRTSQSSIKQFFGTTKSNPVIYACVTQNCNRRLLGTARAKSVNDNMIFLSSRGLKKTVLTHELVHIELHKRMGNKKAWNRIPMWFDEGLAVMVSKDNSYDQDTAKNKQAVNNPPLSLDQLITEQQWLHASRQGKQPYILARKEVQKWYQKNGHPALMTLIMEMQNGRKFSLLKN